MNVTNNTPNIMDTDLFSLVEKHINKKHGNEFLWSNKDILKNFRISLVGDDFSNKESAENNFLYFLEDFFNLNIESHIVDELPSCCKNYQLYTQVHKEKLKVCNLNNDLNSFYVIGLALDKLCSVPIESEYNLERSIIVFLSDIQTTIMRKNIHMDIFFSNNCLLHNIESYIDNDFFALGDTKKIKNNGDTIKHKITQDTIHFLVEQKNINHPEITQIFSLLKKRFNNSINNKNNTSTLHGYTSYLYQQLDNIFLKYDKDLIDKDITNIIQNYYTVNKSKINFLNVNKSSLLSFLDNRIFTGDSKKNILPQFLTIISLIALSPALAPAFFYSKYYQSKINTKIYNELNNYFKPIIPNSYLMFLIKFVDFSSQFNDFDKKLLVHYIESINKNDYMVYMQGQIKPQLNVIAENIQINYQLDSCENKGSLDVQEKKKIYKI